jgi:hypothetical protein
VTVASVADKPTELYVVGATDQWAHEMRPDLEVAPDHTPLIWLIGARQVTSGDDDQVEVLDLVDSEDTRVVCGAEELTRDDKLPRFFKVVDVALAASAASTASTASTASAASAVSTASTASTVSALAVTGLPRGAVVTVTNVRAVETRLNGSLDVTLG